VNSDGPVLIITSEIDVASDLVIHNLQARNVEVFRFNSEIFPTSARISCSASDGATQVKLFDGYGRNVDPSRVRSGYFRKPQAPRIDGAIEDDLHRSFALAESRALISNVTRSLEAPWLNNPDRMRVGEHKFLQLRLASRLGLAIPRTIMTNSASEAIEFAHNCPSGLIAKTLSSPILRTDPPLYIYTNELSESDITRLDLMRYAPCILQELVDKQSDIRVTVVGAKVFAAEILSQNHPAASVDWRRISQAGIPYLKHQLPDAVESRCIELVSRMGLNYGAIDLAYSKNGTYLFLECNPNGEWGWIEQTTGMKLSEEIGRLLATPSLIANH